MLFVLIHLQQVQPLNTSELHSLTLAPEAVVSDNAAVPQEKNFKLA